MNNTFEELFLTIQSVKTRILKGGDGPPLVYLHGAGGGGDWLKHHELLAQHFTVYAPDSPGWGGSDGPEWIDTMYDYVLHYDALLRVLDLDTPVLVGHSLGGWMAAEFAIAYPMRLKALALVNAAGYPYTNESGGDFARPDFFASAARGGVEFANLVFQKMDVAAAYFSQDPAPEVILRRYRELTSTARIAWHCWFEDKLPTRLARIAVPSLVLWGAHDRVFNTWFAERYAEAIPNARLKVLEDCGHMVPFENPEALCEALTELCREAH